MSDRDAAIINIRTYAQKISDLAWEIDDFREKDSMLESLSCIRFNADAILYECDEYNKRVQN